MTGATTSERIPLVAGNWKMHKTRAEARDFCLDLAGPAVDLWPSVELAVCPPFTALEAVAELLVGRGIGVYAQTMGPAVEGAHTGEVSPQMLRDVGATGVVLGHSERRRDDGEGDHRVAAKAALALMSGLTPLVCVGETLAEHEAGHTLEVVAAQLGAVLEEIGDADRIELAYEPVWAIGTGHAATPDQANAVCAHLRALAGPSTRILYGGSVSRTTAGDLLAGPDVDGALVGGASLDPAHLLAIAALATGPDRPR